MRHVWIALLLAGCRSEIVKEEHSLTEVAESKVAKIETVVATARTVTEEPGKVTEEEVVQVFDPPVNGDLKPVLRELRRKKTVTETGAKKDDLRVASHENSKVEEKSELKATESVQLHTLSEPDLGYEWIFWVLLIALLAWLGWRLWPIR